MKNIEEIIRNNKELFDTVEPIDGHVERFNWKLERRLHSRTVRRSIVPYLLKAAAVTVLVMLSSLWAWDTFIRAGKGRMSLGEVSPQYKEAENYYVQQVNFIENEISKLEIESDPEQKAILRNELRSMDSTYVQLQKELKANPHDERIINAMIAHYQTKIDVMNYIMEQLKEIRNETKKETEDGKVSL
jgi:hypothetical protein